MCCCTAGAFMNYVVVDIFGARDKDLIDAI